MSVNVQPTLDESQFPSAGGGSGNDDSRHDDAEQRTMMVGINGSLALLHSKGHTAATFSISPEVSRKVFLPLEFQNDAERLDIHTDRLRRTIVHEIWLEPGSHNSFPVHLGMQLDGIPGTHFTTDGQSFNYIFFGNETINERILIYRGRGDESILAEWNKEFAQYHHGNLETQGVVNFDASSQTILVHENHPVVKFLEDRGAELGTMNPNGNEMARAFREVSRDAFARALDFIRKNILNRAIRVYNMQNLTVRFHRTDGKDWAVIPASAFASLEHSPEMSSVDVTQLRQKFANQLAQKPGSVTVKLGFTYTLPSVAAAPDAQGRG